MQEVPKIVLDRMRAQTGAQKIATSHPDANVLTAFAEQLLPENERVSVVEHLARCGECREVVVLAVPEMQGATAPLPSGSGSAWLRSWLTWPALRWGIVAAGVVIVSVGLLRYQRKTELSMMMSQKPAASAPQTALTPSPAMGTTSDTRSEMRDEGRAKDKEAVSQNLPAGAEPRLDRKLVAPKSVPDLKQPNQFAGALPTPRIHLPQAGAIGSTIGGVIGGPKMPLQWQQGQQQAQQQQSFTAGRPTGAIHGAVTAQMPAAAPTAPPAPPPPTSSGADAARLPASSEVIAVQAHAAPVGGLPGIANEKVETAQVEVQSAAPAVAGDDLHVGKAKPADSTELPAAPTEITDSSGTPQPKYARNVRIASLVPRWTVSASGELQRSFDQGTTWETVNVNAGYSSRGLTGLLSLVPAPGSTKSNAGPGPNSQSNTAQPSSANTNNANANNANANDANANTSNTINVEAKAAKQNATAPVFRAVVAMGSEVWAGGSSGALFHSYDAGNHWSRVVPVSAGLPLTSDIIAIEFSDGQHGRITTSAAEIWTTADDGQTWLRH